MRVDLFDFELPQDRIALHPAEPRESARLLHLANGGEISDQNIPYLLDHLNAGDVLVVNDTKVLPADLKGLRERGDSAAKVAFNLHKRVTLNSWIAFAKPAKKLKVGDVVRFKNTLDAAPLSAKIANTIEGGQVVLSFDHSGAALDEAIKAFGAMPIPPYIASRRDVSESDELDYQTIFAQNDGAVAAPTAGLHFTPELEQKILALGVKIQKVTLHVGAGTFLPVKTDDTDDHIMHSEWIDVSPECVENIKSARADGNKCVAVGTTSMRSLEAASQSGELAPFQGETDIFITPGYTFKTVDVLLTNFHLPRSTLFMLVSAFAGYNEMKNAYEHAIKNQYRFYSYGDACLLERKTGAKT